jgi:hypothetical protein
MLGAMAHITPARPATATPRLTSKISPLYAFFLKKNMKGEETTQHAARNRQAGRQAGRQVDTRILCLAQARIMLNPSVRVRVGLIKITIA